VVERSIHRELKDHAGYQAIQPLNGVGPITAAIFVAEIGDIGRFPTARHLCPWAGMTPKRHESDTKSHRGRITKQGSTIVRWAAVDAVARYHGGEVIAPTFRRIAERRGRMTARVAAARKLLTLVYDYGLRDGEIRCLYRQAA
jgi:transposase